LSNHKRFEEPLITIGIPTKNRARYIQEVLKAIERLEYPREKIKLIFTDDFSSDGTFEILAEWNARIGRQYYDIVLIQERTNISQARNICIKHLEGKYLLFWDSDVLPPKDLLKQMVNMLERNCGVGLVGADYSYQHMSMRTRVLGEPMTNKATHAVYMGFTLIRREVFERVEGFNELLDVGEDTEFGVRVAEKTGYKIVWAPRPVLHLKSVSETKGFGRGFVGWLSYNFHVRGGQYAESFHKLPLLLKLRIFYYVALPQVLASFLFLAYYMGKIWILLMFIAYMLPALFSVIRGSNLRRGTISFFTFNVPTGVALSYGALIYVFKKFLRK